MNQNSQTIKPMMIFILESAHQIKLLEKWSNSGIKCSGEYITVHRVSTLERTLILTLFNAGLARAALGASHFFFLCYLEIFIN